MSQSRGNQDLDISAIIWLRQVYQKSGHGHDDRFRSFVNRDIVYVRRYCWHNSVTYLSISLGTIGVSRSMSISSISHIFLSMNDTGLVLLSLLGSEGLGEPPHEREPINNLHHAKALAALLDAIARLRAAVRRLTKERNGAASIRTLK